MSKPEFSHTSFGRNFWCFKLGVCRLSGQIDILNIVVDGNFHLKKIVLGQRLLVDGEIRTHNQKTDTGTKLIITVAADYIYETKEPDCNNVKIRGRLCKAPVFRLTPSGRQITDLLVAVQRKTGKTDFLPVITWGQNAKKVEHAPVGAEICLCGRLQSREYEKEIDHKLEKKVAFELSASVVELSVLDD